MYYDKTVGHTSPAAYCADDFTEILDHCLEFALALNLPGVSAAMLLSRM